MTELRHTVVAVVVNAASGSSVDEPALRQAFESAGASTRWLPTTKDDPGTGQAAAAVADGAGTVVACGGDGTVRAVLQGMAGSDAAMGIVPLGTGNLLASNLGLPTGLDAVPLAVSGAPRRLDVGVVNDERFAVMAGVGFDAIMIRETNDSLKRKVGPLAYVLAAVRNIGSLRSRLFRARVELDGAPAWSGRTGMVLVGNCGKVTGGLEVFPDAEPDDATLDVAVLSARGLRQWASVLWRLVLRRPQRADLVHRFRGSAIAVHLDRPMPYELDGEIRTAVRELAFGLEPGALQVRVPAVG